MPIHTAVFTKLDTAAAVNEDIPAVTDQVLTVQNNHYIAQEDMNLLAAYARDAGITNARIFTPQLLKVGVPSIVPPNANAAPISLPPMIYYPPGKLRIPSIDEIAFQISNGGAGGVRAVGAIWLMTLGHSLNVPPGDVYTLRATVTITGTAAAWTAGVMVFDQTLPAGTYQVVGLDVVGATTELARLIFMGGGYRPGTIVRPAVSNYMWEYFRAGTSGVLGTFVSTAQPQLEVFQTTGAATPYTVFIDVIKVA
jgi:hypothetical protein